MDPDQSAQFEYDGVEVIPVLREHVQEWLEALSWAHGYHDAKDLADNYRAGRPNLKPGKLTLRLSRARARMEGYLDEPESLSPE